MSFRCLCIDSYLKLTLLPLETRLFFAVGNCGGFSGYNIKPVNHSSYWESRKRLKKKTGHASLVGARLKKQGNLIEKFVLNNYTYLPNFRRLY